MHFSAGRFDSDETIDHFNSSPWWRQFHENGGQQ
jgi:hypothetical protein